jgi:hypothetical protein
VPRPVVRPGGLTAWFGSGCLEDDVLRAFPQHGAPELPQLLAALGDGDEVVAGELPDGAREQRPPVGEEDLGLAIAAGVEQDLAGCRVARVVLERGDVQDSRAAGSNGAPARVARDWGRKYFEWQVNPLAVRRLVDTAYGRLSAADRQRTLVLDWIASPGGTVRERWPGASGQEAGHYRGAGVIHRKAGSRPPSLAPVDGSG